MTVAITEKKYKIDPNWKDLPSINNKLEFEWAFSTHEPTGAVDNLSASWRIRADNVYYVITDIYVYTPGASTFQLRLAAEDWQDFYIIGGNNTTYPIYNATVNNRAPNNNNQLISKWLYIGKPRKQSTNWGIITGIFFDGEVTTYTAFIRGFALKHPLSTKSLYIQPFPLL